MTDSGSCSSCQAAALPVVALDAEGPSNQRAYPPAPQSPLSRKCCFQLLGRTHPPASSVWSAPSSTLTKLRRTHNFSSQPTQPSLSLSLSLSLCAFLAHDWLPAAAEQWTPSTAFFFSILAQTANIWPCTHSPKPLKNATTALELMLAPTAGSRILPSSCSATVQLQSPKLENATTSSGENTNLQIANKLHKYWTSFFGKKDP